MRIQINKDFDTTHHVQTNLLMRLNLKYDAFLSDRFKRTTVAIEISISQDMSLNTSMSCLDIKNEFFSTKRLLSNT